MEDDIIPWTEEMWAMANEEDYWREMGDGELLEAQQFEINNQENLYL